MNKFTMYTVNVAIHKNARIKRAIWIVVIQLK